jgi:hypothetical protein
MAPYYAERGRSNGAMVRPKINAVSIKIKLYQLHVVALFACSRLAVQHGNGFGFERN